MRSLLVLVMLTAPALAEPRKSAEAMHTDDCARARKQNKTCVLDMGGEKIQTGVGGATGVGVAVIQPTKEPSLIHIRTEFITEIIRSAEDL